MFVWSPWLIGSLIIYALIGTLVTGCIVESFRNPSRRVQFIACALGIAVSLTVVNSITWLTSADSASPGTSVTYISYQDFAKQHFGFEPGKAYPIALGGLTTSLEASASAGFFEAEVAIDGGAAFIVSYKYAGLSWDIVVPMAPKTNHEQSDITEPTITLYLKESDQYFDARQERPYSWENCRTVISNLTLARHCTKVDGVPGPVKYDEEAVKLGLAAWLQDRIFRSELRLTPEMHNQLIGKIV